MLKTGGMRVDLDGRKEDRVSFLDRGEVSGGMGLFHGSPLFRDDFLCHSCTS